MLIGGTTSRRESSANRVFADLFFFSQVHVNTTEQIDLQKAYKLGLESYTLFSAPPSTNVNLFICRNLEFVLDIFSCIDLNAAGAMSIFGSDELECTIVIPNTYFDLFKRVYLKKAFEL